MKNYREFYVYKYTDLLTGKVVYIGKTNCSLKARIDAHKREASFLAYSDLYIEFTTLKNEVETDAVEKLLINYYKPAINIKDKVLHLTEGLNLPDLEWQPYRVYLQEIEKNKTQKKEIVKQYAQLDTEFLYDCLGADAEGAFSSRILHPNGTLPFGTIRKPVTNKYTLQSGNVYNQILKPELLEEIEKKEHRILMDIWMPVVQNSNLSEKTEKNILLYEQAKDFASLARLFAYNGYRMNDDSELCELKVPSKYKSVLTMFGKSAYSEWRNELTIEWGDEDNERLDTLEEKAAKETTVLLKAEGVIEYGYTD